MIAKQITNISLKNLSQEAIDDYLDLFYGIRKFHMSRYMYNSTSNGVDWYKKILNKPYYYPSANDTNLLISFIKSDSINEFLGCKLYEIGPGIIDSITNKTISLISFINPKSYTAIDVSEFYGKNAAASVSYLTNLPTEYIICDAFKDLPTLSATDHNLLVIIGNTIGNLTDVELHNFFRSTNQSLNTGDALLLTVDYMADHTTLMKAYNNHYTHQLMLNIMRKLSITLALKDFDCEGFELEYKFNSIKSAVELSLVSLKTQSLNIASQTVKLIKGQKFDMVISRRFNDNFLYNLALRYNFRISLNYSLKDNPMRLVILTKI